MDFEEKTLSRQEIFKGHIFTVAVDEVELPNGLGQAKRELIFHNGAVATLAITAEGKIILVKQYRKAIEQVSLEIPAGKLEVGEAGSEKAAALRELEEETGYTAGKMEQLYDFYSAIGFCNERIRLYLAQELTKVENPREKDADETIELFEMTLAEAKEAIVSGEICDAKTIMAIQHWELMRGGSYG
ncbi:NUDIX hydrolase [Streptococcus merionis]|uniref:NUDIX hydrolase n=1 Tax=Streptococcus merionis TaxID=400065 RepID=UPI0026F198C8|nr:NUDIX hydrolase [Streptococcus merionis]